MNIVKSLIVLAFITVGTVQAQEEIQASANQVTLKCEEYGFKKMNRFSVEIVLNDTDAGAVTSANVYRENLEGESDLVKNVFVTNKAASVFVDPSFTDPTDSMNVTSYSGEGLNLKVNMNNWTDLGYTASLKVVVGDQVVKRNLYCQQIYYAF